jgi:predicted aspartyl protease
MQPSRVRAAMFAILMSLIATPPKSAEMPGVPAPRATSLRPYLEVIPSLTVNVGGVSGRFLLDTGGGITAISPAFASSIGCKPWGRLSGHRMRGQRVDVARCDGVHVDVDGIELVVPTAGVWDFKSVLPQGAPELQGSLALDAFSGHAITLDLGGGHLWIETESSLKKRIESAEELPARFDRSVQGLALIPFVGVQTDSGLLWFELDTGSDAPLIVGKHVVEALKATQSSNGRFRVRASIGGRLPLDVDAGVSDLIVDGNIGLPLLKNWVVTIDLLNHRLWVSEKPTKDARSENG